MEKFFKETLDEIIAEGAYKTAKQMLEMHQTFPEYEEYMKKVEKHLEKEKVNG